MRSLYVTVILLALCPVLHVWAGDVLTYDIDLSRPSDQLPYELLTLRSVGPAWRAGDFAWRNVTDLDGDGSDEFVYALDGIGPDSSTYSALVCCTNPLNPEALFQYNGPYAMRRIEKAFLIDVLEDDRDEIAFTRISGDTVLIEIVIFGNEYNYSTECVPVQVVDPKAVADGWHDLLVTPLAGVDLNGDGVRDILFSRSAKPDSALQRGVVAYDVMNDRELWYFPTADIVLENRLAVIRPNDSTVFFVCAIASTANRYVSNGMDSQHSYLVAIDQRGHEMWRRVTGEDYHYPVMVCGCGPVDGQARIYVTLDDRCGIDGSGARLIAVDPLTGEVVASAGDSTRDWVSMAVMQNPDSSTQSILATYSEDDKLGLVRFNLDLEPEMYCRGDILSVLAVEDLIGDSAPEIVIGATNQRMAVLDSELRLLACAALSGHVNLYHDQQLKGLFVHRDQHGWELAMLVKRDLIPLLWARYKWWMVILFAAVLVFLVFRLSRWIARLYLSSQGLPSLDRIAAGVIVLNRKGKIVFANSSPVVTTLFPEGLKNWQEYHASPLARYRAIVEALDEAYAKPHLPVNTQFVHSDDGRTMTVAVAVYPRVDSHNSFLGKILVFEDITAELSWQRKVVLGETAQRWLHKLKGSMATAHIYLDNIREDERLGTEITDNRILKQYLLEVDRQVEQAADTAGKILRFVRISQPNRSKHDLNTIIDTAIAPYRDARHSGINVVNERQPDLPLISVDGDQMMEVLDNLLSNAVKAVGKKGEVVVRSRLAGDLLNREQTKYVEVEVCDTGCGIAPDDLEQVFRPGFSRSQHGTGVGLSLVKEIVENHNGQVLVESEVGKGSCFLVRLPLEDGESGKR